MSMSNAFVATVPAGITDVDELLRSLSEILKLPGYFGYNWDALSDCLRDFHWIPEHTVVLVHDEIPAIGERDLRIYLDVLTEAIESWTTGENHQFLAAFPEPVEADIRRIMSCD